MRQFAVLCLLFFGGLGAWRLWQRGADQQAIALVSGGTVIGLAGLVRPASIRLVFTGWMMAAFPIGWVVSRVVLGLLFYGVFTPVAAAFRLNAAHGRWLLGLGGIASLVWGVMLLIAPVPGAVIMTWWLGAYALVFGVVLLGLGLRLRRGAGAVGAGNEGVR